MVTSWTEWFYLRGAKHLGDGHPFGETVADGAATAVVAFKNPAGFLFVGIDLPVAAEFKILPPMPYKPRDIFGRIPEKQADFMGEYPLRPAQPLRKALKVLFDRISSEISRCFQQGANFRLLQLLCKSAAAVYKQEAAFGATAENIKADFSGSKNPVIAFDHPVEIGIPGEAAAEKIGRLDSRKGRGAVKSQLTVEAAAHKNSSFG